MQLNVRQSRYFGRAKTLFQLILASTVANLTLVASKLGLMGRPRSGRNASGFSFVSLVAVWIAVICDLLALIPAYAVLLTIYASPNGASRPRF